MCCTMPAGNERQLNYVFLAIVYKLEIDFCYTYFLSVLWVMGWAFFQTAYMKMSQSGFVLSDKE